MSNTRNKLVNFLEVFHCTTWLTVFFLCFSVSSASTSGKNYSSFTQTNSTQWVKRGCPKTSFFMRGTSPVLDSPIFIFKARECFRDSFFFMVHLLFTILGVFRCTRKRRRAPQTTRDTSKKIQKANTNETEGPLAYWIRGSTLWFHD